MKCGHFHAFNTKYTMASQSTETNIALLLQNLLQEQDERPLYRKIKFYIEDFFSKCERCTPTSLYFKTVLACS